MIIDNLPFEFDDCLSYEDDDSVFCELCSMYDLCMKFKLNLL